MKENLMTMNEIRQAGIDVLLKELGPILTARFLRQFETGHGDYTRDREKWLGNLTIKQVFEEARKLEKDKSTD